MLHKNIKIAAVKKQNKIKQANLYLRTKYGQIIIKSHLYIQNASYSYCENYAYLFYFHENFISKVRGGVECKNTRGV